MSGSSRTEALLLTLCGRWGALSSCVAMAKRDGFPLHRVASTGFDWSLFVPVFRITAGQKWVTKLVRVPLLTLIDQGLTCENGSGLDYVLVLGQTVATHAL